MHKIIGCGCSFTYGYADNIKHLPSKSSKFVLLSGEEGSFTYGKVEDYVTKLSTQLGVDPINLARPGASIYAIVKQIEHAITLDPSFVIIGTTTALRIDFSFPEKKLNAQPNINDFNYFKYEGYTENIVSIPLISLPDRFMYDKRYINIFEYHSMYTNEHLKKDQDRFMLLGAFNLLNSKNIPYICVDFTELLSQGDTVNCIAHNWRELCSRFPLENDAFHFNEDGHEFLANEILKHSKGKLT